jgi:hypothetical protein
VFLFELQSFTLGLSQLSKRRDISYTINVYSTAPFRFYAMPAPPPHKVLNIPLAPLARVHS